MKITKKELVKLIKEQIGYQDFYEPGDIVYLDNGYREPIKCKIIKVIHFDNIYKIKRLDTNKIETVNKGDFYMEQEDIDKKYKKWEKLKTK